MDWSLLGVVSGVIAMGVLLLVLAQWSRTRSKTLRPKGVSRRPRNWLEAVFWLPFSVAGNDEFWFGRLPKRYRILGCGTLVVAIIVSVAFTLIAVYAIHNAWI